MPSTAVLVIDLVNDYFERIETLAQQRTAIVEATNVLVDISRQSRHPVIWIREEYTADLHDAPAEIRQNGCTSGSPAHRAASGYLS